MATLSELRSAGRSDLANAILKQGGVRAVAARVDLAPVRRAAGHWDGAGGLEALEAELRGYMRGAADHAFPRLADFAAVDPLWECRNNARIGCANANKGRKYLPRVEYCKKVDYNEASLTAFQGAAARQAAIAREFDHNQEEDV